MRQSSNLEARVRTAMVARRERLTHYDCDFVIRSVLRIMRHGINPRACALFSGLESVAKLQCHGITLGRTVEDQRLNGRSLRNEDVANLMHESVIERELRILRLHLDEQLF